MDFDRVDEKNNERFAVLYPTMGQNGDMKSAASDLGRTDIIKGGKDAEGKFEWRLYQDRIPAGVDVDALFGKYATPEAKAASEQERATFEATKEATRGVTKSAEIDPSLLFYPHLAVKRDFDKLREEQKDSVKIDYRPQVGAYVLTSGEPKGFESFQTPEAKAQWTSEADLSKGDRRRAMGAVPNAIDVVKARVEEKHFLADNAEGFMLVSKRNEEQRAAQIESMKKADDKEIAQVHTKTREAMRELESKELRIRMSIVSREMKAEGKDFQPKAFYALTRDEQRDAAGGAGLKDEEFSKFVSLRSGYFTIRQEAIDRGIIAGTEKSQSAKQEQGQSTAIGAKSEQKEVAENNEADAKKRAAKSKLLGNAIGNGMGR